MKELTPKQQEIIKILQKNKSATLKELGDALPNLSRQAIFYRVKYLIKKGVVAKKVKKKIKTTKTALYTLDKKK